MVWRHATYARAQPSVPAGSAEMTDINFVGALVYGVPCVRACSASDASFLVRCGNGAHAYNAFGVRDADVQDVTHRAQELALAFCG